LDAVRAADGEIPVQVEVDSLAQLDEAIEHDADQILLDNFNLDDMRTAVRRVCADLPLPRSWRPAGTAP
jgi:nicotinate-nucleotide pyrophosphorylase (carboxylating)